MNTVQRHHKVQVAKLLYLAKINLLSMLCQMYTKPEELQQPNFFGITVLDNILILLELL